MLLLFVDYCIIYIQLLAALDGKPSKMVLKYSGKPSLILSHTSA